MLPLYPQNSKFLMATDESHTTHVCPFLQRGRSGQNPRETDQFSPGYEHQTADSK